MSPRAAQPTLPSRIDTLIHQIHAAAGRESRWSGAISSLRDVLGGRAAVLARHDFSSGRGEWLFESPANPVERAAYATEHSMRNPWFISSMDYRPGRVMTGEEILDSEALQRTDFYRRCLARLGLHHRLCGVIARREETVYYADVLRGRSEPAFDGGDRALFETILKHLTVSLENHWTLVGERSENLALRAVMDRLGPAVFVVDETARVLHANSRSAEFLGSFDGLEIRGERIAAASRAENRVLLEAMAEVIAGPSGTDVPPKIVTISNPRGEHPVVVSIHPAGERLLDSLHEHRPAAVLVAKNPHHALDFDRCAFARIFALTPAQGRLAGLILAGHGLSEASRLLGVSENTVRSHLKQVYQKTNTHGQIELVHLHARVCTEHL